MNRKKILGIPRNSKSYFARVFSQMNVFTSVQRPRNYDQGCNNLTYLYSE